MNIVIQLDTSVNLDILLAQLPDSLTAELMALTDELTEVLLKVVKVPQDHYSLTNCAVISSQCQLKTS